MATTAIANFLKIDNHYTTVLAIMVPTVEVSTANTIFPTILKNRDLLKIAKPCLFEWPTLKIWTFFGNSTTIFGKKL